MKIEDYALIGDLRTSALVGRNGSIDWLCLPRTDSAACFAALLGSEEHGRWLLCPSDPVQRVSRRYREGTLILETDFHTDTGTVRVIDFMPLRDGGAPQLVRIVEGLHGEVAMRMQFIARLTMARWFRGWSGPRTASSRSAVPTRCICRRPLRCAASS